MKATLISTLVVSTLFIASPSWAEASERPVTTSDTDRGYAYSFDDDPLDATPEGARGALIHVRRGAKRTLLIRPRTHFINELFKSAENL